MLPFSRMSYPACLLLMLCFARLVMTQGDDATTSAPASAITESNVMCPDDNTSCTNGECQVIAGVTSCDCGVYFFGSTCQFVDIRVLQFSISPSDLTLTWSSPPNLYNYVTAHYVTDISDDDVIEDGVIHVQRINMTSNDTSFTVMNLAPDGASNIVCIVQEDVLDGVSDATLIADVLNVAAGRYCVEVITAYDGLGPYAVAAFSIAVTIGGIIVLLMLFRCCRNIQEKGTREKILNDVMGKINLVRGKSRKSRRQLEAVPSISPPDTVPPDCQGGLENPGFNTSQRNGSTNGGLDSVDVIPRL